MDYKEYYQQITKAITEEHRQIFELLSMDELRTFLDAIIGAERIFVMAAGREGISLRGFTMRLAHLGKPTYWLWDDTTTGIKPGDLFIISDGCGKVGSFHYTLDRVKKAGGKIAMLTGQPDGCNAKEFADYTLFVRSSAYLANRNDVIPTIQMMGNQYEQHLYMLCDVVIMLLVRECGLTYDDLEARHRNVE